MPYINTNDLYVDVYDFTGKPSLSTFALEQTPLTFVPDFTLVRIVSTNTFISPLTSYSNTQYITDTNDYSNVKIRWDFGDGTYQIAPTGVHSYKFPGNYEVKLYLINQDGESYLNSFVVNIQVINYITDKYEFADEPHFIIDIPAGRLSDQLTLKRTNSWQNYNMLSATGYTFNLYASGSGTYYYDIKNYYKDKWAHLKKFFKFVEKKEINGVLQNVIVDKVNSTNQELYAKISNNNIIPCSQSDEGAFFVGTSGYATFYYSDDSNKNNVSTNDPIFIFASLDTSKFYDFMSLNQNSYENLTPLEISYLNTTPVCLPIIKTRYNPAASLTITSNGLDGEGEEILNGFEMSNTSFASTKIPFVIKLKDKDNYTTKSYPYLSTTNFFPNTSYNVKIVLVDSNNNQIPSTTFYKTDFESDINNSGGFYRGYFITDTSVLSAKLSAVTYIDDIPNYEQDTAFIFYSQPYSNNVARYFSTSYFSTAPTFSPKVTVTKYDFLNSLDCRSIFTITQIPSSNSSIDDYCFWVGDSDTDKILKYDYKGNILVNIALSSVTLNDGTTARLLDSAGGSAAPSCIALDRNNNAFVTLFDSGSVIKIDNITNNIIKIKSLGTNTFITSSNYVAYNGFAGENLILPSFVDVDKNNDVFVVLSHPLCSKIMKYDNELNFLSSTKLNNYYFQKLIVDRNNNIWATAYSLNSDASSSNLENRNDKVILFDNKLNILSTFDNFYLPSDITVDGRQHCWISHGVSTLTKIEYDTLERNDYFMDAIYGNITDYIQSLEGISCNSLNEILVINNFDRKIYFLPANSLSTFSLSTLKNIELVSAPNNFYLYPITAYYDDKYQADGDFLGYKWINKFYYATANTRILSGVSNTFNILPTSGYNLMYKKKEDFDGEEMYKNYALTETLQDKPTFFNDFLGTIVGNKNSNVNTALLKKIYEKIGNFNQNIADVNTCNVESLLSKCEMFGVDYENYQYPYPPSLMRILDLGSIKRNILFGNKNQSNNNFTNLENLGELIDMSTDTFSATEIIVAKEKFSNTYKTVNTSIINGVLSSEILPFNTFSYDWGWGLVAPASISGTNIAGYYEFYRLKVTDQEIYNNLLDFNNKNSNLSFNLSSQNDFYGKDGILDQNIAYTFVNGLKLFTSATNVYYN